jgi:phytanoyl-CoA hydroxylase
VQHKKQLESKNLHKQFDQNGFIVLKAYGSTQLENIQRAANQELSQQSKPIELEVDVKYPGAPESQLVSGGTTPRRLLQAFDRNNVFAQWASNAAVANTLKDILQCKQLWLNPNHHNCLMTKLPDFSSDTLWHRDTRYWSFDTPNLVNTWLALGNERAENGALMVIPGSHKITLESDQLDKGQFLNPYHPKNRSLLASAIPVELEAGDVLVFSANIFHAASRNLTDKAKLSLVFTYHGEDTKPIHQSRSATLPEIIIS